MKPLYLASSFAPDFGRSAGDPRLKMLEQVVLPFCREAGLPFALMLGVKRQVNPALGLAGDALGRSQVDALERLCAGHPQNKLLATVLAREDQHQLAVAGRKFRNLHVFGCWWFCNVPSIIRETTTLRLELLGLGFSSQHSDARVLDQLIYKWEHSRREIAIALSEKYALLEESGWNLEAADLRRDAEALMGGNFWAFLKMKL